MGTSTRRRRAQTNYTDGKQYLKWYIIAWIPVRKNIYIYISDSC